MLLVWMAFSLLATGTNGKLALKDLVNLERDECVDAAICNLIKGDLMIDTQGHPGQYYGLALQNVGDSMRHKDFGLESIFTHCHRRRLECEADINHLARNLLKIPIEMLITCPYPTWPFMLFNCENYNNWPPMVTKMIPKVRWDCNTQCHLVEEFEAFQRKEGLTDFPDNWEIIKNLSKTFKSRIDSGKGFRPFGELVYPWSSVADRDPSEVFEMRKSFHDVLGTRDIVIHCPRNNFIDLVEETLLVSPSVPYGKIHHSQLRFGCSRFDDSKRFTEKQLWTHHRGTVDSKTDCHDEVGARFIVGMQSAHVVRGEYFVTWNFTCRTCYTLRTGGCDEEVKLPTECPRYTAACSVTLVHLPYDGQNTFISALQFGCCKLPYALTECGRHRFNMEKINVTCSILPAKPEMKNCSYASYDGMVVNRVTNTAEISSKEALGIADLFERIFINYDIFYGSTTANGVKGLKIRDRFNWTNVPKMTNQLAVSEIRHVIVDSKVNFIIWQPKIHCFGFGGDYELYANGKIKDFGNERPDLSPGEEYLTLLEESCVDVLLSFKTDKMCSPAAATECKPAKPDCETCNVDFIYGITDIDNNTSPDIASQMYKHIMKAYRESGKPVDTHDWVNVPEQFGVHLTVYQVKNVERKILDDTRQPGIRCKTGTIVDKDTKRLSTFSGIRYNSRRTNDGFIETMMKLLGCVPFYQEQAVKFHNCYPPAENVVPGCDIKQTVGFELPSNVVELATDTNKKLLQIADTAKTQTNKARLFDWKAATLTPKKLVNLPPITVPLEQYGLKVYPKIIALDPFVKCGPYTLFADFVKGIGCSPITRLEPFLPECAGCNKNPNFDSLPIKQYNLLYTNCNVDARCVWTLPFGSQNSNKSDTGKEKVDILVSYAPELTSLDHGTPGKSFDWKEVADGTPGTQVFRGTTFDRAYIVPSIECGAIKIYSKKSYSKLFKN